MVPCSEYKEFDLLLLSSNIQARKFIKYLMRRHVYDFACNLNKIVKQSDDGILSVNTGWIDQELAILKGYFREYSDVKSKLTPTNVSTSLESKAGIFEIAFRFLGSIFTKNPASATPTKTSTTITNPVKPNSFKLAKVLLDGDRGAGKTSFLMCAMNNATISFNTSISTIGVDFAFKQIEIGSETIKLQLWDQCSPERYLHITASYYRATSTILLIGDPYSKDVKQVFDFEKNEFIKHATDPEVILITTRSDLDLDSSKSFITTDEADIYAFENFDGALHFHLTNTQLKVQKSIILYCALMKYLLSPEID